MSSERAREEGASAAALTAPLPEPSSEVILEGRGIRKTYEMGDRGLSVLRGVSIEVRKGEILAIQGPSGAGKSTLLHVLGLLDEPEEGAVLYRGEDMLARGASERARYRNEKIGFVFQFYHLFPDLSALENVCLPRMVALSTADYLARREETAARARDLLALVGLAERAGHLPSELSGGERQRVAIARALMNAPEVVLCDEPTGNLDQKTAGEILELLWRLNRETGQTFVIVTHDASLARRAHRSVSVVDGCLLAPGEKAAPRGFDETRFRLRNPGWLFDFRLHPALAFAIAFILPFWPFLLLFFVQERFQRATRRGRSGWAAVLGFLVPLMGQVVWPFIVQLGALAPANRLLLANGERPLGRAAPLIASLLWGASLLATAVLLGIGQQGMAADAPGAQVLGSAGLVAYLVLALTSAWVQSLMNTFFDRMGPAKPER
jgi:ABC-type lipoprotein export system ATPase subunit